VIQCHIKESTDTLHIFGYVQTFKTKYFIFCKTIWNSRENIKINNEKSKTITTPELSLQSPTWNKLDIAEELCLHH